MNLALTLALAFLLALEGQTLRNVNPDDARLLGIVARSVFNQKQGQLTEEQSKLAAATTQAFTRQDFNSAFRYGIRFLLVAQGGEVTEGTELAASYELKLDRKLVAPGEPVAVMLDPLFQHALASSYTAQLALKPVGSEVNHWQTSLPIREVAGIWQSFSTKNLKPGNYLVHYELLSTEGRLLVQGQREFLVHAGVGPFIQKLQKMLGRIRRAKAGVAVETLEYIIGTLDRARKEYVGDFRQTTHPMVARFRGPQLSRWVRDPLDPDQELALAEHLAADLRAGRNPWNARTGEMRLAYRSPVDGTLQPFRAFIPAGYTPARKYPMVVALHGATGDENTYMERYLLPSGESLFRKLAQERGYILVTPNGRGPFGMYAGNAETDVLDVMDRMLKLFSIDPGQVFLTGHSMGGAGTWNLGFKHPQRFAALAPVAGRPANLEGILMKNAPEMPVLYCQGARDTLALPEGARALAEAARKQLKNFRYEEYPEEDHLRIGVTSMPAIFDFFDARRSAAKTSARRWPALAAGLASAAPAQIRQAKPELIKVTDRVYCATGYALGNVLYVLTDRSVVVIDTTESQEAARRTLEEFRKVSSLPVSHIIYTHFHGDHINGARALRGEGARIIAQRNLPQELAKYNLLLPYNRRLNAIQFGASLRPEERGVSLAFFAGQRASGYVPPDILFDEQYSFEEGGVRLELYHTLGETFDHLMVWLPKERVLFPGDLFYQSFPMLASPMKPDRPVLGWAESLERMRRLQPEYLAGSHSFPLKGREEIDQTLSNYARAIRHVHDETVKGINQGLSLEEIRRQVRLPEELARLPYLAPAYGRVEWSINGIYRQYTGWYDFNPAHLNPGPSAEFHRALMEAAGGGDPLLRRARQALGDGLPQTALELTDVVLGAEHDNSEAHTVRAEALEKLAEVSSNTVERNIYRGAAGEHRKAAGK